jgi:hypothetical protein
VQVDDGGRGRKTTLTLEPKVASQLQVNREHSRLKGDSINGTA